MTITQALQWGQSQLAQQDVPLLEAQMLLAHVLKCDRAHFYAHPEQELTKAQSKAYHECILARVNGKPIAYILGHKAFWSLSFEVTEATLIPRWETELLVEFTLSHLDNEQRRVLDLGTGCGAIACSLAHERKAWHIVASDLSHDAIMVAKRNIAALNLTNIEVVQSDWFSNITGTFDAIVGNPPYIRAFDVHLTCGDLPHEPKMALTPGPSGLEAYGHILSQSPLFLKKGGFLALEHGYDQGEKLAQLFQEAGFEKVETLRDHAGNQRITFGYL